MLRECYAWPRVSSSSSIDSDSELSDLASALANGDAEALRCLYRRHHREVRAFACRLLGGDRSAAEDLVQDTFIQLVRSVRSYRGEAPLRGFILGVAANLARHRLRARARRHALFSRLALLTASEARGPEELVASEQLATRLSKAMERLPVDQRLAFVLCELEERSSREAAEILGTNDSTVRARVRAARSRLQRMLDGEHARG